MSPFVRFVGDENTDVYRTPSLIVGADEVVEVSGEESERLLSDFPAWFVEADGPDTVDEPITPQVDEPQGDSGESEGEAAEATPPAPEPTLDELVTEALEAGEIDEAEAKSILADELVDETEEEVVYSGPTDPEKEGDDKADEADAPPTYEDLMALGKEELIAKVAELGIEPGTKAVMATAYLAALAEAAADASGE